MNKETYDKLLTETTFKGDHSGVKAKLKVRLAGTRAGDTDVTLIGSNPSSATVRLSEFVAEELAPAFGEEFIVEVRRPTDEEKEVAELESSVRYLKERVSTRDTTNGARYFLNHPELWAKRELLQEILEDALRGMQPQIPEFFKLVFERMAELQEAEELRKQRAQEAQEGAP